MAGAARVRRKWRPTLGMIVFVVLATVMLLPLVGLFFFRFYENQLIGQTESELIAQTAVLAAVYAREVEESPAARAALATRRQLPAPDPAAGPFHPIEPALDLTADDILGRRPDARDAARPADAAFVAIGQSVYVVARRTQELTLAGFRILDPGGTVVAGAEEVGRSLALIDEVAVALRGDYASSLRLRQLEAPPPLYSLSRGTGVRVFVAMPVVVDRAVAGVVYASRTPNNIFRALYAERRKVLLAGLTIVGVTFLIGFVFSRAVTRPILGLIRETGAVGDGGAVAPQRNYGTREIATLSQSFRDMAARLSERAEYIGIFAAHVSHELKSPLTAIQGAAELLREDEAADGQSSETTAGAMSPAQRRRFLDNIVGDTRRLTALLERLRELARAETAEQDGATILAPVVAALRPRFPALAIEMAGDDGCAVAMSLENAVIVFSHLADNAERHHARHLRIAAARQGDALIVTVADDGDGISAANRARVFDAFFTTRRESGGAGIGLGIVQAMLRSHGGDVALLDGDGEGDAGASFRVVLKLA